MIVGPEETCGNERQVALGRANIWKGVWYDRFRIPIEVIISSKVDGWYFCVVALIKDDKVILGDWRGDHFPNNHIEAMLMMLTGRT